MAFWKRKKPNPTQTPTAPTPAPGADTLEPVVQPEPIPAVDITVEDILSIYRATEKEWLALDLPLGRIALFNYRYVLDPEREARITALTNQVALFKQRFEALRDDVILLENAKQLSFDEREALHEKFTDVKLLLQGVGKNIRDAERLYFGTSNYVLAKFVEKKTPNQLRQLAERIEEFSSSFTNIIVAGDYLYYNSGPAIMALIKAMLKVIERSKSKFKSQVTLSYFTDSSVILALSLLEWITLFNKLKYVQERIPDIDIYHDPEVREYYETLELYYIIVLIANNQGESA